MKKIRTFQRLIAPSLLLVAVVCAAPQSNFAQPTDCTHRISGRVTLDGSTPDARVDVHLLGPHGSDRTTRTNNDGQYAFAKVCPGTYRVRPGPAFLENSMQSSRYTPSSKEVTIPSGTAIQAGNAKPVSLKDIDFMRVSPPGQGGSRDPGNFIDDRIRVDESTRSGRDLKLAREIEHFLENTLACADHLCDLTIKVRNGRVDIAGVMEPNDKPFLEKVRENVVGVRSLNTSQVRSKEQP